MRKMTAIKELAAAAMFTAVIAVLSQVSFPLPSGMPVTLQTFAVALCGYTLGRKLGLLSVAAYIALGAAGVPVFSSFRGGLNMLFGITGGFIFGFLAYVFLCGLSEIFKSLPVKLMLGLAGLVLCHTAGVIQYSVVTENGLLASVSTVSLPFLPKDIISVAASLFLSGQIKKALAKAGMGE
jgi:biotin transport system substrate-specific component